VLLWKRICRRNDQSIICIRPNITQWNRNLHLTASAAGTTGHKTLHTKLALLADLKEILRNFQGWKPRLPLSPAG
jgi:hypothetical protein